VVDDTELLDTTTRLAQSMARHSPLTLRLAKAAVRATLESPLTAGLAHERELFIAAFASEDGREGVRAFLDKRQPVFAGR
jgi:enoyl-CoA hydratase